MDLIKLYFILISCAIANTASFSLHAHFAHYYGHQAYGQNNSTRACEYLGACIARNPLHWRALCNLGTIAFNEQNYADAIKHFDKALEINAACQEARERRDFAQELLKKRTQQEEEQKQQESQPNSQSSQNNDATDEQNSDQNKPESTENKDASDRNNESSQQQGKQQQEEEKNKFDQQKHNQKQQNNTPEQQEAQRDSSQDGNEKREKRDHATSQNKQHSESSPTKYNEPSDKIKNDCPGIQLTPRQQKIVNKIEETDKAAQHYMIMNTRQSRQNDAQKDW